MVSSLKFRFIFCLLSILTTGRLAAAQDWRYYGGDPGGTRSSPLTEITPQNVTQLKPAWTYHTGEVRREQHSTARHRIPPFESTPLVIDDVLYFSTPSNRVIALDAGTGREVWRFDPQTGHKGPRHFHQHRGVAYWQNESGSERRIIFGTYDGRLIELDAKTGKLCSDFGIQGVINLRDGVQEHPTRQLYAVTSPPAIYRDLVITGSEVPEFPSVGPSGMVRAFDIHTGKLAWTFRTIPQPGEPGHETWQGEDWKNRTGANVWSVMSVDTERGMVFLPIGSPSYDFYGGDRQGQNLFGNSLVALDAATGKLIWYYQMVHHDIWDYDLPAQPVLITVKRNGEAVPAVAQVTKMGFVFILDRLTGKPLFPVEERSTNRSAVPGEFSWPTQPVPVKPPPLVRQFFSSTDISTVTTDSNRYCSKLFHSLENHGMYTPFSTRMTLVAPGSLGGANWSGASFDSASHYLFINVNELGSIGAMKLQRSAAPVRYRRYSKSGEYARFWDNHHLPCEQPPWGTLNAINVDTGEVAWRVPLGTTPGLPPKTGTPSLGGTIVTGGLVFIGGTTDSRFRAFDAKTGDELWSATLDANAHATPMTFSSRSSGRQFVVIAVGGGGNFSTTVSDELVAFALPEE